MPLQEFKEKKVHITVKNPKHRLDSNSYAIRELKNTTKPGDLNIHCNYPDASGGVKRRTFQAHSMNLAMHSRLFYEICWRRRLRITDVYFEDVHPRYMWFILLFIYRGSYIPPLVSKPHKADPTRTDSVTGTATAIELTVRSAVTHAEMYEMADRFRLLDLKRITLGRFIMCTHSNKYFWQATSEDLAILIYLVRDLTVPTDTTLRFWLAEALALMLEEPHYWLSKREDEEVFHNALLVYPELWQEMWDSLQRKKRRSMRAALGASSPSSSCEARQEAYEASQRAHEARQEEYQDQISDDGAYEDSEESHEEEPVVRREHWHSLDIKVDMERIKMKQLEMEVELAGVKMEHMNLMTHQLPVFNKVTDTSDPLEVQWSDQNGRPKVSSIHSILE